MCRNRNGFFDRHPVFVLSDDVRNLFGRDRKWKLQRLNQLTAEKGCQVAVYFFLPVNFRLSVKRIAKHQLILRVDITLNYC